LTAAQAGWKKSTTIITKGSHPTTTELWPLIRFWIAVVMKSS
jgi:hypothetical protein